MCRAVPALNRLRRMTIPSWHPYGRYSTCGMIGARANGACPASPPVSEAWTLLWTAPTCQHLIFFFTPVFRLRRNINTNPRSAGSGWRYLPSAAPAPLRRTANIHRLAQRATADGAVCRSDDDVCAHVWCYSVAARRWNTAKPANILALPALLFDRLTISPGDDQTAERNFTTAMCRWSLITSE